MKNCELCQKPFTYRRLDRATRNICGSCMANRHRFALKESMVAYKGGCCQLCGYNKSMRALSFHHHDPNNKQFNFGASHNKSKADIKSELDKCICLCKNCHEEIEEAIQWNINADILHKVKIAFEQPPQAEFVFNRKDWALHHPAMRYRVQ